MNCHKTFNFDDLNFEVYLESCSCLNLATEYMVHEKKISISLLFHVTFKLWWSTRILLYPEICNTVMFFFSPVNDILLDIHIFVPFFLILMLFGVYNFILVSVIVWNGIYPRVPRRRSDWVFISFQFSIYRWHLETEQPWIQCPRKYCVPVNISLIWISLQWIWYEGLRYILK